MNLIDAAHFIGYKLTAPQKNLLKKLDELGVPCSGFDTDFAVNPVTGYKKEVNSLMAALINWTFRVYATYDPMEGNDMTYGGKKVTVQTWDRVRYLILALEPALYRDFID